MKILTYYLIKCVYNWASTVVWNRNGANLEFPKHHLAWNSLYSTLSKGKFQYDRNINICSMDWCTRNVNTFFTKFYIVITFFLRFELRLILYCYHLMALIHSLWNTLMIFLSYTSSCYWYHSIYLVTIRQDAKKKELNSSSMRLDTGNTQRSFFDVNVTGMLRRISNTKDDSKCSPNTSWAKTKS